MRLFIINNLFQNNVQFINKINLHVKTKNKLFMDKI
jgi:hypothetical protein